MAVNTSTGYDTQARAQLEQTKANDIEPDLRALIYAQLATAAASREVAAELRGIRSELERIAG